ncbi:matrix remodeling-associated protein 8 isoform X2 [Amia ocellicauda]|uniref:matrix remodeling-associated protein 8 isoform X2 n=1 Tax=Amia ocellicauda TaxID=2972642 RepID=UPI0034648AFB
METTRGCILVHLLLLFYVPATFFFTNVAGQSNGESVVVAVHNMSAPAGSTAVLHCQSQRMVWIQDRLKDRQRVVHWDLYRHGPEYNVERILDMFSTGDQRIYNAYNQGRVSINNTAFSDGNFSLVIKDVGMSDKGIYSCNLHHHYCHLYESIKVQLNVTKSARREKKFWDGEKAVFVVLVGSTVALPCVNRRPVWTEGHSEEEQQVVHWDRQLPGIRHDRADRLVDMYASGERRHYGPLFLRRKMNISEDAFILGDFSLSIYNLQPPDHGIYSCHLHHHYCGLHERRVYQLTVEPPLAPELTAAPRSLPSEEAGSNVVELPPVINVILPERRSHFLQQLGYILATLLLLALIATAIILLTRRRRKRGLEYDLRQSERRQAMASEFEVDATEMKICNHEEIRLDYKNNIMKEKAELAKLPPPKVIDLDKEMERTAWK